MPVDKKFLHGYLFVKIDLVCYTSMRFSQCGLFAEGFSSDPFGGDPFKDTDPFTTTGSSDDIFKTFASGSEDPFAAAVENAVSTQVCSFLSF